MKEVPLELPSDKIDPRPADLVFDAIDRMTAMDRAYAKAREYEQSLAEALETESETAFAHLRESTMNELNQRHGYINERLILNGLISFNGIDPSKGFSEDNRVTIKEFNLRANDANARSLGYVTLMTVTDHEKSLVIRHKALIDPAPMLETEIATMYQSGDLYLPIDGSVGVQLEDETLPPNFELLDTYVPELVKQIDAAIFDDSMPSKQLRALSKINFADNTLVRDRGGAELKEEIVNYINNYADLAIHGICYIAGSKDVVLPIQDGHAITKLERFRTVGVPHGIEFSPLDNQLVLRMSVPFHGSGMQEMMYVLNPRITLTPAPQLMQAPSRTL